MSCLSEADQCANPRGARRNRHLGFDREILKLLMRQFLTKKLVCESITGA
jgi:hypothetical protein